MYDSSNSAIDLPLGRDGHEGLAILPYGVQPKDLIVYFEGARVPFLVRPSYEGLPTPESFESSFSPLRCTLVGECLMTGFEEFVTECRNIDLERSQSTEWDGLGQRPSESRRKWTTNFYIS
jgi:hypothetical protein